MIECYCEIDFLKKFAENLPNADPYDNANSYEIWRNYSKMILNDSLLYVDNENEIDNWLKSDKDNKFAFLLYKKKMAASLNEKPFESINFDAINPHSVFFIEKELIDQQLKDRINDYLVISNKTIFSNIINQGIIKNISPQNFPFPNWSEHPWDGLKKFKHPCNYMIIADNYILEDDRFIEDNLIKILFYWLPEHSMNTQFNLFIITDGFEYERGRNRRKFPKYQFKERYDRIKKELKKKNYPIKLTIAFNANSREFPEIKNHGRSIITNYFKMHCDHSFTMFDKNKKCKINAEFYIKSILDDFTRESIDLLEKQYLIIIKKARNTNFEIEKISSTINLKQNNDHQKHL